MSDDPFDDIAKLRIDPATFQAAPVPAKIRQRRKDFVMLPMSWYDKLARPVPTCRATCLVAWHLLYLNWKSRGRPFKLPNGTLKYDGISRFAKDGRSPIWRGVG